FRWFPHRPMPHKLRHRKPANNRVAFPSGKSVSIIGAGRVGTALGIALKHTGYTVNRVVAKHSASARRAVKLIGSGTAHSWKQFTGLSPAGFESDILIIATPDDVMAQTVEALANLLIDPLPD